MAALQRAAEGADQENCPESFSTLVLAPQDSHLCEPLRRLQWLRQELDLWNEAEAARPMPQPQEYGLALPPLKPSEVFWVEST